MIAYRFAGRARQGSGVKGRICRRHRVKKNEGRKRSENTREGRRGERRWVRGIDMKEDTKEQCYFSCQKHSVQSTVVVSPSVWSP